MCNRVLSCSTFWCPQCSFIRYGHKLNKINCSRSQVIIIPGNHPNHAKCRGMRFVLFLLIGDPTLVENKQLKFFLRSLITSEFFSKYFNWYNIVMKRF